MNRQDRLWDVYKMPNGNWAYTAVGQCSDNYVDAAEAHEAMIDYLCYEVVRLAAFIDERGWENE